MEQPPQPYHSSCRQPMRSPSRLMLAEAVEHADPGGPQRFGYHIGVEEVPELTSHLRPATALERQRTPRARCHLRQVVLIPELE